MKRSSKKERYWVIPDRRFTDGPAPAFAKRNARHPAFVSAARSAAAVYARGRRSDPFAYGRMLAHILNGIETVADAIGATRAPTEPAQPVELAQAA